MANWLTIYFVCCTVFFVILVIYQCKEKGRLTLSDVFEGLGCAYIPILNLILLVVFFVDIAKAAPSIVLWERKE